MQYARIIQYTHTQCCIVYGGRGCVLNLGYKFTSPVSKNFKIKHFTHLVYVNNCYFAQLFLDMLHALQFIFYPDAKKMCFFWCK